ncbi:MAG: Na/Pi cotransporter family protein [Crocinitomicaceae bacterium]|nr:Na/Pi cotransporter family protein [Crocinitomicaceae bacterium]
MKRILFIVFAFSLAINNWSQSNAIIKENNNNPIAEKKAKKKIDKDIFNNLKSHSKPEALKLTWSLDYDLLDEVKDKKIIIKYNTKIGSKRAKKGFEGSEWKYTKMIDLKETSFEIKNLQGAEKYEVYIGLIDKNDTNKITSKTDVIWSKKVKAKTERGWGVMKMLILIGSLGLFIFGMKIMSDGMQRTAGEKLKKMLGSITSNRFKGILTGFSSTSIVQSSSVTTVMTVSLVNAGLINLRQSAGVMMGANIGTTITAWLVLMLGFKVSISSYALVLIAFGAPLLFFTFRRSKDLANAIIGFAILFIGLQFLKDAVPDLDNDSPFVQFFINYKDIPFFSNLMFVALGTLVTVVIQSSSAAMAITMTMVAKGIIPFEVACAMVLGENIGTTITADLASMIGNVHAKRAARFNSMFNIIGVTWMLLVIPLFLDGIGWIVSNSHNMVFNPNDPGMANEGIALFHTLFNCINVLVLVGFVPHMVRLVERTVKSKGDSDEEFKLDYITGAGGISFPEVSILEANKEVAKFGSVTSRMNGFVRILINDQNKKTRNKMYNKIIKYEEITDRVEVEVANYLDKVSTQEISQISSSHIRSMLSITNDLERIGDIYYQMSKTIERKEEKKIFFLPEQRDNINNMLDILDNAFEIMIGNLNSEFGHVNIDSAKKAEREINQLRNQLRKSYLKNAEKGEYEFKAGIMYNDLFSSCEKIGDHIINVSEAMAGEI